MKDIIFNFKVSFKKIKTWCLLKWIYSLSWIFSLVCLIVEVVLLVIYKQNPTSYQQNLIASFAFAFLLFLIIAIFSHVIHIYRKRKILNDANEN